jgi:hypothetical protein
MSCDPDDSCARSSRIPLVCSPPRLEADTRAKRLVDRLLLRGTGCREAHCVVSGVGWALLAVVEIAWRALHGTNALILQGR